ncbi:MAG: glycosyltransferase [Nitrososphaeraceae archaeon]
MKKSIPDRVLTVILIGIIITLISLLSITLSYYISPNNFDSYFNNKIKQVVLDISNIFGNILINFYQYVWLYLPLGIIGFWRWSVWIFKKSSSFLYHPIEPSNNHINRYSIITPVYNEDPIIFEKALNSWIQNRPNEIIAVIDQKDEICIEIFRKISRQKKNMKLIITDKPGKRPALVDGIKESKEQIIALVDSDTIWSENIRDLILAPFADPKIGGVTTRQHPVERNSLWQKITDIFWDMRNYYDLPAQTAMGQALSCLSGRTSLYRKEIVLEDLNEFLNEVVLERKKESGEDKCLTRIIQSKGWKSYYQSNAVIYSHAAEDFRTFWSQRLRWSRNSHNSDLISLWNGWAWKHPFLAFHMIDRFITIFTLFFGPIFFTIAMYLNHHFLAFSILMLWMVGRGIKILPHLRRYPKDIMLLPIYVIINFMVAIIKLYALVTIRDQKWIRSKNRRSSGSIFKQIKNFILTSEIISSLVFIIIYILR